MLKFAGKMISTMFWIFSFRSSSMWGLLLYKGVSINPQTKLIMKYTVLFLATVVHSKVVPFQICNRFSISDNPVSTAGNDILESHLGQSAVIPEFPGHPGNGALIATVSFSETRGQLRWVRRVEVHSHVRGAKNWFYFCLLVSNWGKNFVEICHIFSCWHVP